MSFKVASSPKFWTDVELEMVAEDGRQLKGKIKVQFTRMGREQFAAFSEENRDERLDAPALLKIVHDWQGAEDDSGAVPFTPENFKAWCDMVPGSYLAIGRTFFKIHSGLSLLKAHHDADSR